MGIISGGRVIEGAADASFNRSLGSPAVGATTAVHAAVNGAAQDVTTAITNPDVPRNVTATSGGTAGDIKAVAVTVYGTNAEGVAISEVLPVFTVDSPTTVVGSKAFATVTRYTVPAHDGTGATTAIGTGAKLGIGDRLPNGDTVSSVSLGGTRESTRPTVASSASALESNTVQLSSTLNGSAVRVEYSR